MNIQFWGLWKGSLALAQKSAPNHPGKRFHLFPPNGQCPFWTDHFFKLFHMYCSCCGQDRLMRIPTYKYCHKYFWIVMEVWHGPFLNAPFRVYTLGGRIEGKKKDHSIINWLDQVKNLSHVLGFQMYFCFYIFSPNSVCIFSPFT